MIVAAADPVKALSDAWIGALRAGRHSGSQERSYVYASRIRSCTRAMALDLLHPEDDGDFPDESLARMKRGEEREQAIVAWLHQIGPRCSPPFKVIEGQRRFEIKDRDGSVLIVGKIDCRLKFEGGESPFVEVKSGESVRSIETLDDFDHSPWTRHMPDQLLSYLYAESCPWGLFILDRPGMPAFVRVDLEPHLARVEGVLGQVRRAIDVKREVAPIPPFIEDQSECRRCCHWKKSCDPALDFGSGAHVVTDESILFDVAREQEIADTGREYERLHKRNAGRFRGIENAIAGDFMVTGKWGKQTRYDVPDEIRDQHKVVDEQGRWTMKIEKLS